MTGRHSLVSLALIDSTYDLDFLFFDIWGKTHQGTPELTQRHNGENHCLAPEEISACRIKQVSLWVNAVTHHQGHLPFTANECGCLTNLQCWILFFNHRRERDKDEKETQRVNRARRGASVAAVSGRLRPQRAAFGVCEMHCAPGATRVIYQAAASVWKFSFLPSDREALCVSAENYASSPTWEVGGDTRSVLDCAFCFISKRLFWNGKCSSPQQVDGEMKGSRGHEKF